MEGPQQGAQSVLHHLTTIAIVFVVLDTFFLALRTISRCFVKKVALGWDDLLLYPGYVVNLGLCIMGFFVARYEGVGNPPSDDQFMTLPEFVTHLEPTLKCLYALGPLFAFGYSLPKISLLLFYLRIFVGKRVQLSMYIMIAIVVAEMIAFLVAAMNYCTPVPYYWHRAGDGHCFDADPFYRSTSAIKVIIDLGMVALPLQPLWQLQVSTLKKIGLTCVFATSIFGVIGGIVRFVYLCVYTIKVINPTTTTRLVSIIIVEPNLFFITACLPACSSLFMELYRKPGLRKFFQLRSEPLSGGHNPYSEYSNRQRSHKTPRASDDLERLVHETPDLGAPYVAVRQPSKVRQTPSRQGTAANIIQLGDLPTSKN